MYTLWCNSHVTMERSTIFNGKTHYFNGNFHWLCEIARGKIPELTGLVSCWWSVNRIYSIFCWWLKCRCFPKAPAKGFFSSRPCTKFILITSPTSSSHHLTYIIFIYINITYINIIYLIIYITYIIYIIYIFYNIIIYINIIYTI